MKTKKINGFTLVELVIVIAVIAVLAAVLIPTFSSLIRKANISSDTVLAKNLNTAVSLYKAENGNKDMTFEDALKAVKERGYVLGNLNAKAKDCYFVWENQTDQFLLIEETKEGLKYNILFYSEEGYYRYDFEKTDENNKWHFSTNDVDTIETLKEVYPHASYIKIATTIDSLLELINAAKNETVYLNDNIELNKGIINVNVDNNEYIILDLNSLTLDTNQNNYFKVKSGKLVIKNGNLNDEITGNALEYHVAGGDLVLDTMNITSNYCALVLYESAGSTVEINSSKIASENAILAQQQGGTVIINDSKIEADNLFAISNSTRVIINSGICKTESNEIAYLNVGKANNTIPTMLLINGGDFSFGKYAKGQVSSPEDDAYMIAYGNQGDAMNNTVVAINGGTFNGLNYLEYFRKHTSTTKWKDDGNGHCYYQIADGYFAFYTEKEVNGKTVVFLEFRTTNNYNSNNKEVIDYVINNNLLNK